MEKELGLDSDTLSAKPDERVQQVGTQLFQSLESGFLQSLNPPPFSYFNQSDEEAGQFSFTPEEKKAEENLTLSSIVIGRVLNGEDLEERDYWQQIQELSTGLPTECASWEPSNDEVDVFSYPFLFFVCQYGSIPV